jgi:GTP-binding protein LepA
MLHMDVFKQRLEQEFEADIILTNPAVPYRLNYVNGTNKIVENPCEIPYHDKTIDSIEEPIVQSRIMLPAEYMGNVMTLCDKRRGKLIDTDYLNDKRVVLKYELPLAEMAENQFFNELKQSTSGYASLDYEEPSYKSSNIVRLDVLLNGKPIDALSQVTHASNAVPKARNLASKLKDVIDRQQFQIAIQVCVNGKPAARETIQAYRKDVTAKCYGGDQTRKRKLLDRQKEQKKGMKRVANVDLPKTAFLTIIKQ